MIETDQANFLIALREGNRKNALAIAKKYVSSHNQIKLFYDQIVKPSLYKVGELWEYNEITVVAEHLATAITESIMNELYSFIINENRTVKKVVLGCIESEQHQVGIKMVADVFEMHGWDTFFLGAGVPNNEFINYAKLIAPDAIGLSLSIYAHLPKFAEMLNLCMVEFPELPILAGGQAFLHGGEEFAGKYEQVYLIKSLAELETYILKLMENE